MSLQDSSSRATSAIAVLVDTPSGQRFFHAFGKSGCVQTAWSLAGAKLFIKHDNERINQVTERLAKKNKSYTLHEVSFSSSPLSAEASK